MRGSSLLKQTVNRSAGKGPRTPLSYVTFNFKLEWPIDKLVSHVGREQEDPGVHSRRQSTEVESSCKKLPMIAQGLQLDEKNVLSKC